MNQADGHNTADRLSAIVANSLDTQAKTQDLARQAYQSRTQFHRLFRTVVEETPAAMRRRLLLERAAYQLGHTGLPVTDVALDANYGSLEAFTRAFRRAFRTSPSLYRRIRDPLLCGGNPATLVRTRQHEGIPVRHPPQRLQGRRAFEDGIASAPSVY